MCAVLIGLLYVSPVLEDVARTGLDWPIWIDHPEGLIHTNYGKWWVLPPHHYLVDGSSGEFPIYYPSLSDSMINVAAEALGCPAMTVQAVLFGPLLGSAFLLLNYLSIAAVVGDRRVALGASLLISLGGNSSFFDRPDPVSGLPLNSVLHVPFRVISLATAQSLGWLLLLPCLSLMHLAYRGFSRTRAVFAGVLLAALFHSHTLTFVNVSAAQLAYLAFANALERPRDRRFKVWLVALSLVAAAFALLVATRASLSSRSSWPWADWCSQPHSSSIPTSASTCGATGPRSCWRCPTCCCSGGTPGACRRAERLEPGADDGGRALRLRSFLRGLPRGRGARIPVAPGSPGARLGLGAPRLDRVPGRQPRLALGQPPVPLRHHLLFPLAILAALGVRDAPRPLAAVLGAWLGAVCLFDAGSFALGEPVTVRFRVAEPERAAFLETVRDVTSREAASGLRLLAPVELTYPRGLVQATMLMNYSRIPAFVPDHRHVLWPERHHNRMGLFCFLFPGYPNDDYPFGRRACEEELDPDPALGLALDPRLKAGILPVYRIGFAGGPAKPFSNFLKDASSRYGWPILAQTDNAAFVRTDVPRLSGVARLTPLESPGSTLAIRVEPDAPGRTSWSWAGAC